MKKPGGRKMIRLVAPLLIAACCVATPFATIGLLTFLTDTPYERAPESLYKLQFKTREISGFTVLDKSGEYYEHKAKLTFTHETGITGSMDFSFLWDVIDGFYESAVTFDHPNVTYDVGPADNGWRRLTIRCEGMDIGRILTARFIYPADALVVRDTPHGYYRWDLDEHMSENIPELNLTISELDDPYACADWINRNISYETVSESPQTAAKTFYSGKGDCDDIAILFCYMVKRMLPHSEPRVVEGWTTGGRYHANALIHTDSGWLMLDPSFSSVKFGVFDFGPFVPSGRISVPFHIRDAEGRALTDGELGAAFDSGTVKRM
jgi:hypothetical protein